MMLSSAYVSCRNDGLLIAKKNASFIKNLMANLRAFFDQKTYRGLSLSFFGFLLLKFRRKIWKELL